MTAVPVLGAAAGLLVAGGLVVLVTACFGQPAQRDRRPTEPPRVAFTRKHALAIGAGVVVLLLTGWPVAAVGTAAAVLFVPTLLGGRRESERLIARSDALAGWTRRLADLLSSGAAGSLDEALRKSVRSCPSAIAPEVSVLAERMGPQGTEVALRRFADEVDDAAAERVAGALILRSRHGGRGLADVLLGLAGDLEERTRMVREVEAERAKPRSSTRIIMLIVVVALVLALVWGRDYLSVYSSFLGQIALAVNLGIFAVVLRLMRRASEPVRSPRFLTDPTAGGAA